mgnify:CR=1 FL=1
MDSITFIYVSLTLWQIGFIIGILLKLFYKPSGKNFVSTTIPAVEVETPKIKPTHVDVAMNKKILMDKPKVTNLSTDEVIKGKVKTQKDKLKQMRGL